MLLSAISVDRIPIPKGETKMKTATKVMYILGLVANAMMIIGFLICVIVFSNMDYSMFQEAWKGEPVAEEAFALSRTILITVFGVLLGIEVLICWVGVLGIRNVGRKGTSVASHVISIVLGVLGVNFFYLLGGIFGLVAESDEATPNRS